jgi:hypothetical protein
VLMGFRVALASLAEPGGSRQGTRPNTSRLRRADVLRYPSAGGMLRAPDRQAGSAATLRR